METLNVFPLVPRRSPKKTVNSIGKQSIQMLLLNRNVELHYFPSVIWLHEGFRATDYCEKVYG